MFKKYSVEYDPKTGYFEVVAWWGQEAGHGLDGDVIFKHTHHEACRDHIATLPKEPITRVRTNGRF